MRSKTPAVVRVALSVDFCSTQTRWFCTRAEIRDHLAQINQLLRGNFSAQRSMPRGRIKSHKFHKTRSPWGKGMTNNTNVYSNSSSHSRVSESARGNNAHHVSSLFPSHESCSNLCYGQRQKLIRSGDDKNRLQTSERHVIPHELCALAHNNRCLLFKKKLMLNFVSSKGTSSPYAHKKHTGFYRAVARTRIQLCGSGRSPWTNMSLLQQQLQTEL